MWINRPTGFVTAAVMLVAAGTPVAHALDAPDMAGGALTTPPAHHSRHIAAQPRPAAAITVSERVWEEINDALAIKLLHRPGA
ncbi:MAG TPA: hypothetical protein VGH67_07210 [Solirubrobacteraceae bacterium]|jgi:hypothetical protein